VIDAAVHLWSADAKPEGTGLAGDPDTLFRDLATAGVSRAVVIQSSSYGDDHRYLLEQVGASAGRLAAVGLLRARGADAAGIAARLLDAGCAGLRVIVGDDPGWPASDAAAAVWDLAEHRGAPVGLLAAPAALDAVAALAEARPALPLVLDHLGLVSPAALDAARVPLARLARAPRAFIKVSALRAVSEQDPPYPGIRPLLTEVRDLFGYDRMIYGTDWPYAAEADPYRATIDALDAVYDWSPAERDRVVESNAAGLWWRSG